MRGLKLKAQVSETWSRSRIFYRCVDWNLRQITEFQYPDVASFTDAWIETLKEIQKAETEIVASFTDAWIETEDLSRAKLAEEVASFTDAWIETSIWK